MGCQQCGRRPGDLYCLNDDGCPNDPQYEPRQDWACEPAPTDCEDQGYSLLSDGCIKCQTWEPGATKPTRPALVKEARYGRLWWMCPKCHGSYGDAGPAPHNAQVTGLRRSYGEGPVD